MSISSRKNDSARFHALQRHARHLVHVDELLLLFLHQVIQRLGDAHAPLAAALAEKTGQHIFQIDAHLFDAAVGGDFDRRPALFDFDLHHALVEFAVAQALAQLFTGALGGFAGLRLRRHQQIEQPFFGVGLGALGHFVQPLLAHHVDGDVDQIANHGFDVAADIAHFGELAGLHFHERRIGELGQAPRQLRFADAGGADHEDVLGHHLIGHLRRKFLAANAVAQRDGHGALGFILADDVFIQLAHDLARRELVENRLGIDGLAGKIDHHG